MGTLVPGVHYCSPAPPSILIIARLTDEVLTPTCRAISALEAPSSRTHLAAIIARVWLTLVLLLPARSSSVDIPCFRHSS